MSLPTHSSQVSQSLLQTVAWVHGGHFSGSPASAAVHVAVICTVCTVPFAPWISQQPKQSHPFGASGLQNSRHWAVTAQSGSSWVLSPVRQSVW